MYKKQPKSVCIKKPSNVRKTLDTKIGSMYIHKQTITHKDRQTKIYTGCVLLTNSKTEKNGN
jgi:hypothetical protein